MLKHLNTALAREQEDVGKTERTAEAPEALLAEKAAVDVGRMDVRLKEAVQKSLSSAAKSSSGDLG